MMNTTDTPTPSEAQPVADDDRLILRKDLPGEMRVTTETVRRWLRDGKLPEPDVNLSQRTRGWRLSTLRRAGINLPSRAAASQPSPAASSA